MRNLPPGCAARRASPPPREVDERHLSLQTVKFQTQKLIWSYRPTSRRETKINCAQTTIVVGATIDGSFAWRNCHRNVDATAAQQAAPPRRALWPGHRRNSAGRPVPTFGLGVVELVALVWDGREMKRAQCPTCPLTWAVRKTKLGTELPPS